MPSPFSFLSRKQKHTKESEIFDNGEQGERQVLTTVYRAENPVIDIVAVHGLNGDAIKSFTSGKNQKFWLGDTDMLPRDLANCRILTFSYPASVAAVFGKTSSETILQHATTLVHELVADRQMDKAMERPIVFLCHSLGGIIVKRALIYSETRKSKTVEHIHSIFVSTYGILFFGTPHQGSSKANLATFVQRMVATLPSKLVDTDSRLLDALVEGSETLQDITDNFQPKMNRFHVFFFWEQGKSDLGVKMDYVVRDFSAAPILDGTERAGLPADHRNMCKFAARTSPGYNLVVATLRRYADGAPGTISRRWVETKELFTSLRRNEVRDLYEGLE